MEWFACLTTLSSCLLLPNTILLETPNSILKSFVTSVLLYERFPQLCGYIKIIIFAIIVLYAVCTVHLPLSF